MSHGNWSTINQDDVQRCGGRGLLLIYEGEEYRRKKKDLKLKKERSTFDVYYCVRVNCTVSIRHEKSTDSYFIQHHKSHNHSRGDDTKVGKKRKFGSSEHMSKTEICGILPSVGPIDGGNTVDLYINVSLKDGMSRFLTSGRNVIKFISFGKNNARFRGCFKTEEWVKIEEFENENGYNRCNSSDFVIPVVVPRSNNGPGAVDVEMMFMDKVCKKENGYTYILGEDEERKEKPSVDFSLDDSDQFDFDYFLGNFVEGNEDLSDTIMEYTDILGGDPLMYGIAHGRMDVVKYLVEKKKWDVDRVDHFGFSPLQIAGYFKRESIKKYLLKFCGRSSQSHPLIKDVISGVKNLKVMKKGYYLKADDDEKKRTESSYLSKKGKNELFVDTLPVQSFFLTGVDGGGKENFVGRSAEVICEDSEQPIEFDWNKIISTYLTYSDFQDIDYECKIGSVLWGSSFLGPKIQAECFEFKMKIIEFGQKIFARTEIQISVMRPDHPLDTYCGHGGGYGWGYGCNSRDTWLYKPNVHSKNVEFVPKIKDGDTVAFSITKREGRIRIQVNDGELITISENVDFPDELHIGISKYRNTGKCDLVHFRQEFVPKNILSAFERKRVNDMCGLFGDIEIPLANKTLKLWKCFLINSSRLRNRYRETKEILVLRHLILNVEEKVILRLLLQMEVTIPVDYLLDYYLLFKHLGLMREMKVVLDRVSELDFKECYECLKRVCREEDRYENEIVKSWFRVSEKRMIEEFSSSTFDTSYALSLFNRLKEKSSEFPSERNHELDNGIHIGFLFSLFSRYKDPIDPSAHSDFAGVDLQEITQEDILLKLYNERERTHNLVLESEEGGECLIHKELLVFRSDYFQRMFEFDGIERDGLDDPQQRIKIMHMSNSVLATFVDYVYTGKINSEDIEVLIMMIVLSNMYTDPVLMVCCLDRITTVESSEDNNVLVVIHEMLYRIGYHLYDNLITDKFVIPFLIRYTKSGEKKLEVTKKFRKIIRKSFDVESQRSVTEKQSKEIEELKGQNEKHKWDIERQKLENLELRDLLKESVHRNSLLEESVKSIKKSQQEMKRGMDKYSKMNREVKEENELLQVKLRETEIENEKSYSRMLSIIRSESTSRVLSPYHLEELKRICGFDEREWKLLYRASRDGYSAKSFHQKCDNVKGTLVLIRTEDGDVIGGWSPRAWNDGSGYVDGVEAWIFGFQERKIVKIDYDGSSFEKEKYKEGGIFNTTGFGPIFGANDKFSLCIFDDCDIKSGNYAVLGNQPGYPGNGSVIFHKVFKVIDYEVYVK